MCSRFRVTAGSTMEPEPTDFRPQVTDEQWALIADLFAEPPSDPSGGRPELRAKSENWYFTSEPSKPFSGGGQPLNMKRICEDFMRFCIGSESWSAR